jgi:hypothetical protein
MIRAVVFLAATLLAASLGVVAQQDSTDNASQQSNNTAQSSADSSAQSTHTITGCLAAPAAGGSYILTDASGIAFRLTGNTDSLEGHTGQEIQVTGQHAVADNVSTSTSSPASSPTDTIHRKSADEGTIRVTDAKVIAEHCQPVGGSQPSSDVKQGPRASSSRPTATNDSVEAAATANSNDSVEQTASDEDTRSARANAQLPQTSTLLPLLGLIGLGSLVAGFFARR